MLAWQQFDGEVVLRNAATGNTHLLEGLSADVLGALLESGDALSVPDLTARLGGGPMSGDDGREWQAAIQEVLNELHRLGLAEPLSS